MTESGFNRENWLYELKPQRMQEPGDDPIHRS